MVEWEGWEVEVLIDFKYVMLFLSYEYKNKVFFYLCMFFKIKDIMEDGLVGKVGIKFEDQIIGLDGQFMFWFIDFVRVICGKDGVEVDFIVLWNIFDILQFSLIIMENGMIGVEWVFVGELFGIKCKEYSFV